MDPDELRRGIEVLRTLRIERAGPTVSITCPDDAGAAGLEALLNLQLRGLALAFEMGTLEL